ncbi:adenylosuccinate lyase [Candidatus Peregrinibacteria bacterium CG10_big_fil_rev_8_21_14_0_10_36_19]|nr:MAG: adenylosuccinate lyase [Candidatus Peregrinibacteria bacterium CG10_big_fil_rev_8_21_14_0_10_36_19]
MEHNLLAISPLDGRYRDKLESASHYFSEAALMRYRCLVEIEWLIFLFNDLKLDGTKELKSTELRILRSIYEQFDLLNAKRVKDIEKTTNHDVKAIEYFIKEQLKDGPLDPYLEFVHFACTSEDINNLSYACMVRDFVQRELAPSASGLIQEMYELAVANKKVAMLSRTHGQTATPTTLGKELINVVARLEKEFSIMNSIMMPGKINGAVGNYNAHIEAYPKVDWVKGSQAFVESLGLEFNKYTTQIEPHDIFARLFDSIKRFNTIVLDFDRDMWTYISMGYFGQRVVKGEVGSSTMPHKVNPIDFENSEGNLGLANAMLEHLSAKLPVSRMQRDLTDSTVCRNIGSALSYALLAYKSTIKGLSKCEVNKKVILDDLKDRWEVLAEPIQVVMRRYKIEGAYEALKELTRGKSGITKAAIHKLVDGLKIPAADKKRLLALTPDKYIGVAEKLVDEYELDISGGGCGPSGCGGCQGCG